MEIRLRLRQCIERDQCYSNAYQLHHSVPYLKLKCIITMFNLVYGLFIYVQLIRQVVATNFYQHVVLISVSILHVCLGQF